MKKVVFAILSALVLCACESKMGPQEPLGKTVNISVSSSQWTYTNFQDGKFNNYFFSRWDMPELTVNVFKGGNVQGYIYLQENGVLIQHDLPYVLHKEIIDAQGNQYIYTTTIDFVYGVGWVQFELRDSDFDYETYETIVNPEAMDFRIVMTY